MTENYNTYNYWNNRINPNTTNNEPPSITLLKYFKKHNPKTILDYGPGDGRNIPIFKNTNKLYLIDISTNYKTKLLKKCKDHNIKDYIFIHQTQVIPNLSNFYNNFFDCTVCSLVFLHQKPTHIEFIMKELARISKEVFVTTYSTNLKEYDNLTKKSNLSPWCFNYNYKELCKKLNFKMKILKSNNKTGELHFTYRKKILNLL
jgi:ubiquinone/menaquinone biosynthesis C-methylase UbiE